MTRRVTQDDVAKRAGVTRSVVSYVLNGNSRSVAPDTRERILAAIEALGYRPNKAAQSLGTGMANPLARKQIGIVMNHAGVFRRPYYAEILEGIHRRAHEEGYHIRFIRFFHELQDPLLFNSLIHAEEVCGVILLALDQSIKGPEDRKTIQAIVERVPNAVCLEWQAEGLSSVTFNRQEAAIQATRHLLGLGHRRIGYIGEADERVSGFRQAMLESGIVNLDELLVTFANDMASGNYAAHESLPGRPDLTAVVAGSDEVAFGIMSWLHTRGRRIPEDLAMVSIDNLEFSQYSSPPLSSINVQKEAMGRMAVQLILAQEATRHWDPVTIHLPSSLVVRQSCGSGAST